MGEGDGAESNGAVVEIVLDIGDERTVDFQVVDREEFEISQR